MDLEEVLRCLAEADVPGRRRPELCGGRYALVEYGDGWPEDDEDDESGADSRGLSVDSEDAPGSDGGVIGETLSVYDAFDLLAAVLAEELGEDTDQLTAECRPSGVPEREYEQWLEEDERHLGEVLRSIASPRRRLVAYFLMGSWGPMDLVTADFSEDVYLGYAPAAFEGARFVFLASAAPPNQDVAYGILELQPSGIPTDADQALIEACRRGDVAAIATALAAGANVDALDERGMAPLHHATAHEQSASVAALLAAGADPNVQAEFGNAPQFAAVSRDGQVSACAERLDNPGHWQILKALFNAGARIDAANRTGQTALDLAIRTHPYPREAVHFLIGRGAHSGRMKGELEELLDDLPYPYTGDLENRMNEVRFLLDSGADTDGALPALLNDTGYYEKEVPGRILLGLVEEILRHGVPEDSIPEALEQAERWVEIGLTNYAPVVDRLRKATLGL